MNRSLGRAVLFCLVLLLSSGLKSNLYVQVAAGSLVAFFALSLAVVVLAGRLDLARYKDALVGSDRASVEVDGMGLA